MAIFSVLLAAHFALGGSLSLPTRFVQPAIILASILVVVLALGLLLLNLFSFLWCWPAANMKKLGGELYRSSAPFHEYYCDITPEQLSSPIGALKHIRVAIRGVYISYSESQKAYSVVARPAKTEQMLKIEQQYGKHVADDKEVHEQLQRALDKNTAEQLEKAIAFAKDKGICEDPRFVQAEKCLKEDLLNEDKKQKRDAIRQDAFPKESAPWRKVQWHLGDNGAWQPVKSFPDLLKQLEKERDHENQPITIRGIPEQHGRLEKKRYERASLAIHDMEEIGFKILFNEDVANWEHITHIVDKCKQNGTVVVVSELGEDGAVFWITSERDSWPDKTVGLSTATCEVVQARETSNNVWVKVRSARVKLVSQPGCHERLYGKLVDHHGPGQWEIDDVIMQKYDYDKLSGRAS